jgi:NADH dehydrogenase
VDAKGGTLVLGGGFAGSYVARLLGKHGATIVSPENFMLYTPMLPEAASGTLEPRHVVVPLRMMCPHAELVLGSATGLDTKQRRVRVETEDDMLTLNY